MERGHKEILQFRVKNVYRVCALTLQHVHSQSKGSTCANLLDGQMLVRVRDDGWQERAPA